MNNINDCIIINLKERYDLWNNLFDFRNSWISNKKKIHRIEGVNLKDRPYTINEFILNNRINLNGSGFLNIKECFLGELGCFMGHFNSWKYIVDNNIPYCIIMEDGVNILRNDFNNIHFDDNIDILFINKEMFRHNNIFTGFGLQGYIVSLSSAKKLISLCYTLSMPIDLQIRHLCNNKLLIGKTITPPYVSRNNNRLSSIRSDINPQQDTNSLFIRILQNLLKRNFDLNEFI